MRVTKEKVENGEAYLNVEMEPAEVEVSLQQAYSRLVKKVRVPGFRKGKAPRGVLERHLGHEGLLDEALNRLVPEAYARAVKEQGLEPVAQPHLEVVQTDPVVFKAVVPLRPEVKLGDYRQVRLEPPPVEFSPDSVDAVLEQLRRQQATWEPVERPVALEDLAVMAVEGRVAGESLISRKGVQYPVVADAAFPAPGFAQQLVGMKAGEEKEFSLTLPEDYGRSEMAGKEAAFRVSITEVKQPRLPELSDELAKGADPESETLAALREKIATELKAHAEERAAAAYEEQVIQAVVDGAQLEFPPVLVEAEIDHMMREAHQRLQMTGRGLEGYLNSVNKTPDELRDDLRPVATKRVRASLVLDQVAAAEKIEAAPAEVDAEIEKLMQGATEQREEMEKVMAAPQVREQIEQSLISRKTVARLKDIAGGVAVPADTPVDKEETTR